jgi:hypothetical protein
VDCTSEVVWFEPRHAQERVRRFVAVAVAVAHGGRSGPIGGDSGTDSASTPCASDALLGAFPTAVVEIHVAREAPEVSPRIADLLSQREKLHDPARPHCRYEVVIRPHDGRLERRDVDQEVEALRLGGLHVEQRTPEFRSAFLEDRRRVAGALEQGHQLTDDDRVDHVGLPEASIPASRDETGRTGPFLPRGATHSRGAGEISQIDSLSVRKRGHTASPTVVLCAQFVTYLPRTQRIGSRMSHQADHAVGRILQKVASSAPEAGLRDTARHAQELLAAAAPDALEAARPSLAAASAELDRLVRAAPELKDPGWEIREALHALTDVTRSALSVYRARELQNAHVAMAFIESEVGAAGVVALGVSSRSEIAPVVASTLAALLDSMTPRGALEWFASPRAELSGKTPRELVAEDPRRGEQVLPDLARGLARALAA